MASTAARTALFRLTPGQPAPMAATAAANPLSVTFGTGGTALGLKAYIALSPDFTLDWWTWQWEDITAYVRWDPDGFYIQNFGRRQNADPNIVDHSVATTVLDNRDKRFSRGNPFGPYYGKLSRYWTPIRFQVDPGTGFVNRYFGFINSLPKRWDRSGTDAYMPITCSGPFNRLRKLGAIRSPLFYSMAGTAPNDYVPLAYWPMEDASTATQFASGLTGGLAVIPAGGIAYAADSTMVGSQALPTFTNGSLVGFPYPAYTDTNQWVAQFTYKMPSSTGAANVIGRWFTPGGTAYRYDLNIEPSVGNPDAIFIRVYDVGGTQLTTLSTSTLSGDLTNGVSTDFYGHTFMYTVAVLQHGANVDVWLKIRREDQLDLEDASVSFAGTDAPVTQGVLGSYVDSTVIGHHAIFTDPNFSVVFTDTEAQRNGQAMDGHNGELAHVRIARVFGEQRIPYTSAATTSAACGPQSIANVLDVATEAAKADGGVVYEHEFGGAYQSRSERYDKTVRFNLDFAQGHIIDDPQPEDYDLVFHNQWLVGRTNGSTYLATQEGGLAATDVVYQGQDTQFDVQLDTQLPNLGGYLVRRDSIDEDYWPNFTFSLRKSPALIPDWIGFGFGQRANVANPPDAAIVTTIETVVEGWSEKANSLQWEATLNTSQAAVDDVGIFGPNENVTAFDSQYSTLAADVTSTATTFTVTDTGTRGWMLKATYPEFFPFNIIVGGVVYSVTDLTGSLPTFTFTVVRLATDKAHVAGTPVHVYRPARFAY